MTDLVPCPMCGAEKGYTLSQGSTHRWWLPVCLGCGEQVSECRSDPDLPYTALVPDRWGLADAAWNEAGKHAQGLRDEIAALKRAAQEQALQALSDMAQADDALRLAAATERERIARHFDERDRVAGGFYGPEEPSLIIRALGDAPTKEPA